MKQLLLLLLFCITIWAETALQQPNQKAKHSVHDWVSLSGTVEEVLSPSVFIMSHPEGIQRLQCSNHGVIVGDKTIIKGTISSVQNKRIKTHMLFKDNSLIFQRGLGSYDTLSIPSYIDTAAENLYLYRYSKKLRTSAQVAITIGTTITVSTLAIGIKANRKREQKHAQDDTVSKDLGDALLDIAVAPVEVTADVTSKLIFGTSFIGGTVLLISGLSKYSRFKKLPTIRKLDKKGIKLSLQPGGTIHEPGLFLVGTF